MRISVATYFSSERDQPNRLRLEEVHITEESDVAIATAVWYFVRAGEGGGYPPHTSRNTRNTFSPITLAQSASE